MRTQSLDDLCVTTLRMLSVDMVEKAKSGHPGLPLGAAPMAYALWDRYLSHDPADPHWWNRDRFVLSPGHGSALLYSLLHLTGYDLPLAELKRFRQWGSRTPGHPEYGLTPGVEATTGPLGQGFAMGVGMALAERYLASVFNRPGMDIVDHWTYGIVSDGDLMEGISSEAASLAGTMNLGRLVYLYDDNHISIEGDTDLAFGESVQRRFEAYGWHVLHVRDGNDVSAVDRAIQHARSILEQPSLVIVRNHIGYGSPKQDQASAHGEPLGPEALAATKAKLGWAKDANFVIPADAEAHFRAARSRGAAAHARWDALCAQHARADPGLAAEFARVMRGDLPAEWAKIFETLHRPASSLAHAAGPASTTVSEATRESSGRVLNAIAARLPEVVGGSADLSPSTKTTLIGYGDLGLARHVGRNIHFGVREHAMTAIANGMALHGGIRPYCATFLIFSDYARPAIRLAALMGVRLVFIGTHDSVALGEDGPTHQPIEQLASLRAIPGLTVLRPADASETAEAWRVALERSGPVILALARQSVPVLDPARYPIESGVRRGAYVLVDGPASAGGSVRRAPPQLVIIATGSEVHLALEGARRLEVEGIATRVVSMPSWEIFDEQPESYRRAVLPEGIATLAIEAAATFGWRRYVGPKGSVLGIDRFGASAPGPEVMHHFGFTPENVVARAKALLIESGRLGAETHDRVDRGAGAASPSARRPQDKPPASTASGTSPSGARP
ncbi:MAG: transketolase [Thermoplasmatota archaeon]